VVRAIPVSPQVSNRYRKLLNGMFRKTWSERKYSALDIDPAVYSNFAWLTISAIKAVPHDLFDLRPVRDTDIPQCPVIEFYQNSDNLFDLTFATPLRPSASNRAPRPGRPRSIGILLKAGSPHLGTCR